jgi:hypothetical protein
MWLSPNEDILMCLLDMRRNWTTKAIRKLNRKMWREWGILVSHFLFNNSFGLPLLTLGTICTNQLYYVWLVDLQNICAKYGLETWFSPNDDIRKYLLYMHRNWTKNAFWDLNNKKWHKWCKFVSIFLFNNIYGLPVLTMGTKRPNPVFYIWKVDLQIICAK